MPYPNDLIGKAIQLHVPKVQLTAPNTDLLLSGHGHDLTVPVFSYIPGHPGDGRAPRTMARLTNLNAPWNITFLAYVPGEVTTVKLRRPVLTGPMSGCYLFRYVVGGPRIAHVGTHDHGPDAPPSVRAKNKWKDYLAQTNPSSVMGASPVEYYADGSHGTAQEGRLGGVPAVYGLFEPDGSSYAVVLAPMGSDVTPLPKMMRFFGMKPMRLQPWSAIGALRTFR